MATLIGLDGTPTVKVHKALKRIDEQLAACGNGCVLIIPERQYIELSQRYPLEPVAVDGTPLAEDGEAFGMYRYRTPAP